MDAINQIKILIKLFTDSNRQQKGYDHRKSSESIISEGTCRRIGYKILRDECENRRECGVIDLVFGEGVFAES